MTNSRTAKGAYTHALDAGSQYALDNLCCVCFVFKLMDCC